MNRKIGIYASIVNVIAVFGFALSMLLGVNIGSYFCSLFIAFSFISIISAYCFYAEQKVKLAGYIAVGFAVMYATIISLVYFAQLTTVQVGGLSIQAKIIIDFQEFGLFFNYDMLGYALMSLSTFFIGLTINLRTRKDSYLKYLLLVHGSFFITCLFIPMLGLFHSQMEGSDWIGVLILIIWCIYFIPVGYLSYLHFSKY